MPRPLWSGSLSFGLVNVPVVLRSAARDLDVHFHELHAPDGARLERRRVCAQEDVEVDWDEIARSHELEDGTAVVVTDEELATAAPEKTRTIDVEAFVALDEIDPIQFDHPYLLLPAGDSDGTLRAYRLLAEAIGGSDLVALGRLVLRTKEHLAAIRVRDGVLALTTMLFHDEIRPASDVPTGGRKPADGAVKDAVAIIDELSVDWDPERYEDCYRERLERVIDEKRSGGTVRVPEQEDEPAPAPDLMKALEESLAKARGARRPDGNGRRADGGGDRDRLEDLTVDELAERAKAARISGRSKMKKDELVAALRDR